MPLPRKNRKIRDIIDVSRRTRLEFAAQVVLMGLTGAIAWIATGMTFIPLWIALHYGLIALERRVARRLRNSDSPWALALVLLAHLAVGIAFAAMPAYLWLQDNEAYHFAGMVLLVGSILNIFLVRAQVWYLALCFVIPDAVALTVIGADIAAQAPNTAEAVSVWAVTAAIVLYLSVAVVQAARMHRRHLATRAQLIQSQKMEALGNLAGGMAHDFNNILNVITGTLDLVRDERDPDRIAERLDRASQAAERGAGLIRQVLSFARRSHLEPRRVAPERVLAEVEQMARRLIPERIAIEVVAAPGLPPVRVDESTLVTALLNLVLNGRDAIAGRGRIVLGCALAQGTRPGRRAQVVFSVRDDGRGIARDLLGKVTDPFFTTKPVGEGTGLGLSMVAGFAAQSGGALTLDSREGAGTEACILLPVDDRPEAEAEPPPEAASSGPAPAAAGAVLGSGAAPAPGPKPLSDPEPVARRRIVLVVEDQRELLELLQIFLRRSGHEVHAAVSGDAALALIEDGLQPDLLITDLVMPGQVQGRDLAAILRNRFPAAQIVLMSGFEQGSFGALGTEDGSVTFLAKPVRLADLAAVIAPRADGAGG